MAGDLKWRTYWIEAEKEERFKRREKTQKKKNIGLGETEAWGPTKVGGGVRCART